MTGKLGLLQSGGLTELDKTLRLNKRSKLRLQQPKQYAQRLHSSKVEKRGF